MTPAQLPTDIDPFIAERVVAIRDRFGIRGLRAAHDLIESEMAIFDEVPPNEDQNKELPAAR